MGSVNRWLLARTLRAGTATPEAWPDERIDAVWDQFDQGTQRAILRLHRSIDTVGLAQVGAELGGLDCPALVVWGELDPWLDPGLRRRAMPTACRAPIVERVAGAGHWPWLDQPQVIERIASFRDPSRGRVSTATPARAPVPPARPVRAFSRIPPPRARRARRPHAGGGDPGRRLRDRLAARASTWPPTCSAPSCSARRASASGTTTGTRATTSSATACCSRRCRRRSPRSSPARWPPPGPRRCSSRWPAATSAATPGWAQCCSAPLPPPTSTPAAWPSPSARCPALGAVSALDSDRPGLACALAVLSALCSPVAALFAAVAAGGYALGAVLKRAQWRAILAPVAVGVRAGSGGARWRSRSRRAAASRSAFPPCSRSWCSPRSPWPRCPSSTRRCGPG